MRIKKMLAAVATGSVLTSTALVALAGSASALPQGPELDGDFYWFNQYGAIADQTPATQINSGSNAQNRPFVASTVVGQCPAGTVSLGYQVRIPQAGVPEDDWVETALGAVLTAQDADGNFYSTTQSQADRLNKPTVMGYLAANGGVGDFPLLAVCRNSSLVAVGHFRTTLHMTGTSATDLTWSIPRAEFPKLATTTALTASAGTVEVGSPVTLTADVAPDAATGDVEFLDGTTSLGTATIVTNGVAELSTSSLAVGMHSVTAVYAGDATYGSSTSAAVSVEVTAAAARATTTTLVVSPTDGFAYKPVSMTATVTAATGTPAGVVRFLDGAAVLGQAPVQAGVATFTSNVLGAGSHSLTAVFVGTAPYSDSTSAPVVAEYAPEGDVDLQVVDVEIPAGAISITTPYHPAIVDPDTGEVTPANPLHLGVATLDPTQSTYSASAAFEDIVITDTRAGDLGFTASVLSGPFESATDSFPGIHAGLTGLVATQVPGNALQAADVVLTPRVPFVDGLDVPKVFAQYAAGQTIGTAHIEGVFGVDQVPTSVTPGLYTATVTFTAV